MHWLIPKIFYKIYEKKLYSEIKGQDMPQHIGIILDGNRRASRKLGINYNEGYELGAKKLEEVLNWCWDLNIKVVSVWVFSTDNFKHKVRIRVIGRKELLPKEIQEEIAKTEEATKEYEGYTLNICMAYGGRAELTDAIKEVVKKVNEGKLKPEDITEEIISEHLYTRGLPDPDLIIRTSGEERLSGFLLWQSAYSELYFADVYWPLFRRIDLWRAIRIYQQRHRRFGK